MYEKGSGEIKRERERGCVYKRRQDGRRVKVDNDPEKINRLARSRAARGVYTV